MSIYVMSDIHGQYEKFKKMLKMINLQDSDTLYILGDMVDRGPQSMAVVQHVMNAPNMKAIIGNHEEMLLEVVKSYGYDDPMVNFMIRNTYTEKTYNQLRRIRNKNPREAMSIVKYLRELPTHIEVEVGGKKFLLVHAGIKSGDLSQNTRTDFLWIREEFLMSEEEFPFTVIFGHTPTPLISEWTGEKEECKIWKKSDRIGIDCGATFLGGKLACMRLDDFTEYYVS